MSRTLTDDDRKQRTDMDTSTLRDAYRALLEAAATVVDSGTTPAPPAGEWDADQILAHVALLNAVTITAVAAVQSGAHTTYDNRITQDAWTIERAVTVSGGNAGLRERIRVQADALCLLVGPTLSEPELDTLVPSRLVSHDAIQVDQPLALKDLLAGLAVAELPGHTDQLLALLPTGVGAEVAR